MDHAFPHLATSDNVSKKNIPFCGCKMFKDCCKTVANTENKRLWHLMCQLRVSQLDFLIFVFCTFESLSTRSISRKVASSLPLASIGRGPAQVEEFGLFSQFSLESPFSSPGFDSGPS